jgi:predicted nucleotidyltransferase
MELKEIIAVNKVTLNEIVEKYNIELLVYFGSYGTKFYNSESDIDIAFLSASYLSIQEKLELLEDLIHYHKKSEIDLVDLRTADPVLRYEIAVNGRVLFEKEENLFERYSLFYIKSIYEHKSVLEDKMRKIAISVEEVLNNA